jgi:hypothetical protein
MTEIAFITIAGEILLPLALLVWVWRGACSSRGEWLLRALSFSAYLSLIAVAGIWLLAPWYLPYGFGVLGLGAVADSWRRTAGFSPRPAGGKKSGRQFASALALAAFCTAALFWALGGYAPPEGPAASLTSPLKGGTYYVANGGYSILINPHMKTLLRESLSGYRAQSYALDMVRIDRFGLRAEGLWPVDLERYHIFGEPVYAPCAGVVAQTEGQLPDQTPPETDPQRPAGNFVRLECGEFDVLLAHLMHASLTVYHGQRVQRGHLIGRVGNSGLSTEPHLHLHAQRRGPEGDFLAGEPMPVSIDGRFLVRNSRLAVSD